MSLERSRKKVILITLTHTFAYYEHLVKTGPILSEITGLQVNVKKDSNIDRTQIT